MNACIQMVAECVLRDWDILLVRKREDQSFGNSILQLDELISFFFLLFYNVQLQSISIRLRGYIYETGMQQLSIEKLESKLPLWHLFFLYSFSFSPPQSTIPITSLQQSRTL